MFVTVEARATLCFRVVAMPDTYIAEADRAVQILQRQIAALIGHEVISGNMAMACIDTCGHGHDVLQTVYQFGDLFKGASKRELSSRGVFDQNGESLVRQFQTCARLLDGSRDSCEAFFARCATKRSRMEYKVVC